MTGIEGSCHCGAVHFTLAAAPETVTRCTCSICTKMGMLWTYYSPEDFAVTQGEAALSSYSWGRERMDFRFCGTCSCMVHWRIKPELVAEVFGDGPGRVGINARLLDGIDATALPMAIFEGNSGWLILEDASSD